MKCWLRPSGKYYEDTRPEDMVLINIRTNEYDKNSGKPSSEFKLHSGIYADRPEFSAIIHTHQMNASTCAGCPPRGASCA